VGVRKSDGGLYFVVDIVDIDVDDGGGGDIVFGVATVIDLVGEILDTPREVNLLGETLGPPSEGDEGKSMLLRRE